MSSYEVIRLVAEILVALGVVMRITQSVAAKLTQILHTQAEIKAEIVALTKQVETINGTTKQQGAVLNVHALRLERLWGHLFGHKPDGEEEYKI